MIIARDFLGAEITSLATLQELLRSTDHKPLHGYWRRRPVGLYLMQKFVRFGY